MGSLSATRTDTVPPQGPAATPLPATARVAVPAAPVAAAVATPEDDSISLDGALPAGEETWVPAPEDRGPAQPALASAGAAIPAGSAGFELPQDG